MPGLARRKVEDILQTPPLYPLGMKIPEPEEIETVSGSEDTFFIAPHTSFSEEGEIILEGVPVDPDDPVVKVWVYDCFAIPPSSAWDQTQADSPGSEYMEELDDEGIDLNCFPAPISISRLPFGEVRISVASREFVRKARGKSLIVTAGEEGPE